jgi:hypothetical protein
MISLYLSVQSKSHEITKNINQIHFITIYIRQLRPLAEIIASLEEMQRGKKIWVKNIFPYTRPHTHTLPDER